MVLTTTIVDLDLKNPDAYKMIQIVQQASEMFVRLFDQDDIKDEGNSHLLRLTFVHLDRIAAQPGSPGSIEKIRARISAESLSEKKVFFYLLRPDMPGGNDVDWYLSSNGIDLDTPSKIFHRFLEEFRIQDHRRQPLLDIRT